MISVLPGSSYKSLSGHGRYKTRNSDESLSIVLQRFLRNEVVMYTKDDPIEGLPRGKLKNKCKTHFRGERKKTRLSGNSSIKF